MQSYREAICSQYKTLIVISVILRNWTLDSYQKSAGGQAQNLSKRGILGSFTSFTYLFWTNTLLKEGFCMSMIGKHKLGQQ